MLQDYNQLKKYNDKVDGGIKQFVQSCNLSYFFLNSNDEDTLKELSESLGKKEVKKILKSTSYDSRSKGSNIRNYWEHWRKAIDECERNKSQE